MAADSSRASETASRRIAAGSGPCLSTPRELLGRTVPGAQPGETGRHVGRSGPLGAESGSQNYPSELGQWEL